MLFACSAAILIGLVLLYGARYRRPHERLGHNPVLNNLALLEPKGCWPRCGESNCAAKICVKRCKQSFMDKCLMQGFRPRIWV